MKAVIYARVSSKEQEQEGFSIPSQLKLLRNYAQEKGIVLAEEFKDIETAKSTGRTGFNKMLKFLKSNKTCNIVLAEKTDRLYRNIRDWITLDELNIEIHFVKEGCIISQNSHSSEKFLHGIKVLMAKNYIDNLSEEVKKGLTEKAAQGEWPTKAPVGYKSNKSTHLLDIDELKAPLVRKLFELYATGNYSLQMLMDVAREAGFCTNKTTFISKSGIHKILQNPIYYGEILWKGKRYQGKHQPIITKKLFDQVQAVLEGTNHPKETKRNFAFAGLLKCDKCGCAMTPELKKGKYIYYRCTGFKGKCGNTYIREEKLAELLADVVKRIEIDDNLVADIKKALRDSHKDKIDYHNKALKTLNKRAKHIQGLIDKAYEDKLSGVISESFWERKSLEWQNELVEIASKVEAHNNADVNYFETGIKILELANNAYTKYLGKNRHEQRKLLNIILSNCTIFHGTLYPTYKKPFHILAERHTFESKLGYEDLNPDQQIQSLLSYHWTIPQRVEECLPTGNATQWGGYTLQLAFKRHSPIK